MLLLERLVVAAEEGEEGPCQERLRRTRQPLGRKNLVGGGDEEKVCGRPQKESDGPAGWRGGQALQACLGAGI